VADATTDVSINSLVHTVELDEHGLVLVDHHMQQLHDEERNPDTTLNNSLKLDIEGQPFYQQECDNNKISTPPLPIREYENNEENINAREGEEQGGFSNYTKQQTSHLPLPNHGHSHHTINHLRDASQTFTTTNTGRLR
jgi:hypothetical protein